MIPHVYNNSKMTPYGHTMQYSCKEGMELIKQDGSSIDSDFHENDEDILEFGDEFVAR